MTSYNFASRAKLLTVQTDVIRHVVRALKVLDRAKEEGMQVDPIFAQFFASDALKNLDTLGLPLAVPGNLCASSSSSTLLDSSSQSSGASITPSSSPAAEEVGKGKRPRVEGDTEPEANEPKRARLEEDGDDMVLQSPQEIEQEKIRSRQWKEIIPDLSATYQKYHRKVQDGTFFRRSSPTVICLELDCQKYEKSVCYFYNDQYSNINATYCACESVNQVLISNGLFPASPHLPQIAISAEVLDRADGVADEDMDDNVSCIVMDTYTTCEVPLTVNYKGDMLLYEFRTALMDALPWYREVKHRSIAELEA